MEMRHGNRFAKRSVTVVCAVAFAAAASFGSSIFGLRNGLSDYVGIVARTLTHASNPLTFTSASAGGTIKLERVGSPPALNLDYSTDGENWETYSVGDAMTLSEGGRVHFRAGGVGNATISTSSSDYYRFVMTGRFKARGFVAALLRKTGAVETVPEYCFYRLFDGCDELVSAPKLPDAAVSRYCYAETFRGCCLLKRAPTLFATDMAEGCHSRMFQGCTNLVHVKTKQTSFVGCEEWLPETDGTFYGPADLVGSVRTTSTVPTTWFAPKYDGLHFRSATGGSVALVKSHTGSPVIDISWSTNGTTWGTYVVTNYGNPVYVTIPTNRCEAVFFRATTKNKSLGASSNYNYFKVTGSVSAGGNVMSLLDANCDNATNSPYCFRYLFYKCTGLTSAPSLPATTLANNCYAYMFSGCSGLKESPEFYAEDLGDYCCQYMFQDCSMMAKAYDLNAKTLNQNCYASMFRNCSSLTEAPALEATTLANSCCNYMFYGCKSLVAAPTLNAETLAYLCYNYMFNGCTSLRHVKTRQTSFTGCSNWLPDNSGAEFHCTPTLKSVIDALPSRSKSDVPPLWTVIDDVE